MPATVGGLSFAGPRSRPEVRHTLVLAMAVLAVAAAIWLDAASIHIVAWRAGRITRVALLPTFSRLAAVTAAASLVGGILVFLFGRAGTPLATLARIAAPMNLLWLWVVPYVPWLPDRLPLLVILAGPVRWLVLGAALAGSGRTFALSQNWKPPVERLPGARAAFAISFAVYVVLGLRFAAALGPTGDEPHYLMIAQSLLADGDLKIENNHRAEQYRSFYPVGNLAPHFLHRGADDEIYSIHAPGLPVLLLPAYAIGGYTGAVLTVCLFAAAAAWLVFLLAERLVSRAAAWLTWVAFTMTVPLIPHGWMIYPELPAVMISAAAVWWLWQEAPTRTLVWLGRGTALALYPWLHTKFVVLMALLPVVLLLRVRPRVTQAIALLGPVLVSGVLWLLYFRVIYGVFDPVIPYGSAAAAGLDTANIPHGLVGLLFDQEFGLLLYSPVYLLACAGLWYMVRHPAHRWLAAALVTTTAVFVAGVTRSFMWWGGSTPPARFLVPVLPFIAPMLAFSVKNTSSPLGRAARAGTLALSLITTAVLVRDPNELLLANGRDGTGQFAEWIQAGTPLAAVLPTLTSPDWMSQWPRVGTWVLSIAAALAAAALVSRQRPGLLDVRPYRCLVAGGLAFALTGSVLGGTLISTPARTAAAAAGRMRLMEAYDGSHLTGLQYSPLARLAPSEVLEASSIVQQFAGTRWTENLPDHIGPYALTPGRYEIRIWYRRRLEEGTINLVSHPGPGIIGRIAVNGMNPTRLEIEVPVPLPPLYFYTEDAAIQEAVSQVDIVPLAIVPRSDRLAQSEVRDIEWIKPRTGALIVYLDQQIFRDGGQFWTRGGTTGRVLLAPAGARAVGLAVRCGPAGGAVNLVVGDERAAWSLAPGETRRIGAAVGNGQTLVPIEITTPGGFRPADIDPSSTDRRWLGCHVSIDLS